MGELLTYAVMDETGVYPKYITNGLSIPDGAIVAPKILPEKLAKFMWVNDEWVERPTLQDFVRTPTNDGVELVTPAPNGTMCTLTDKYTNETLSEFEVTDGQISITLPDAGVYVLDVVPPPPTMQRTFEVAI